MKKLKVGDIPDQTLADYFGTSRNTVLNYKNGNPKATPKQNEQKKRLYGAMLAFYRNEMRKGEG